MPGSSAPRKICEVIHATFQFVGNLRKGIGLLEVFLIQVPRVLVAKVAIKNKQENQSKVCDSSYSCLLYTSDAADE